MTAAMKAVPTESKTVEHSVVPTESKTVVTKAANWVALMAERMAERMAELMAEMMAVTLVRPKVERTVDLKVGESASHWAVRSAGNLAVS